MERAVDTVKMARQKFPGSPASLDALCKRFAIDLSGRDKHGALLDAELLADVYLELMGGRQDSMRLEVVTQAAVIVAESAQIVLAPRQFPPSETELAAHAAFLKQIRDAIWLKQDEAIT
jgi:DNA polymerase-3 subunit epsilon